MDSDDSTQKQSIQARSRPRFDVFLSHSHHDSAWVESLGARLEDEHGFEVWFDRWILTAGGSWQQEMARGLDEAATCAVCIGDKTPSGWFSQEIQRALNIQAGKQDFRVIPVLLPTCPLDVTLVMPAFLELRTWADFRDGADSDYAFHVLMKAIEGEPIGRWPPTERLGASLNFSELRLKLEEWRRLKEVGGLHERLVIEIERELLAPWIRATRWRR